MTMQTKILVGILLLALLGGGVWFLLSGQSEISFSRVTPEQASKASAVLNKDSDNDELKDWEEELWRTDALLPDTDADGTLDGEEVKTGRDPLKAGPQDKLDKEIIEKRTVPGGGDWTETDRISRELFARYLSIRQSGSTFTADDERKLLEEFADRYPKRAPQKTYTLSDIARTETDDTASLRAYANGIGSAISAHETTGESELIIFERALENEDEGDLSGLEGRVARYQSLLSAFLTVPVPESAEDMHISLLNSLESLKESVSGMAMALKDPVRSLSSATAYPVAVTALVDSLGRITNLLALKKISFEKTDPGYILTK